MCEYCNPDSPENEIRQDGLTNEWYLNVDTYIYDNYDKEYIYRKVYINYCPYCGRDLYKNE